MRSAVIAWLPQSILGKDLSACHLSRAFAGHKEQYGSKFEGFLVTPCPLLAIHLLYLIPTPHFGGTITVSTTSLQLSCS